MTDEGELDDETARALTHRHRIAILDAMIAALDDRERLFAAVETASDPDAARGAVMAAFGLDEGQAEAVLNLQVLRFTAGQVQRIRDERARLLLGLR